MIQLGLSACFTTELHVALRGVYRGKRPQSLTPPSRTVSRRKRYWLMPITEILRPEPFGTFMKLEFDSLPEWMKDLPGQ